MYKIAKFKIIEITNNRYITDKRKLYRKKNTCPKFNSNFRDISANQGICNLDNFEFRNFIQKIIGMSVFIFSEYSYTVKLLGKKTSGLLVLKARPGFGMTLRRRLWDNAGMADSEA